MEEQFTTPINQNHTISLKDRNTLDMTGVKTIQSFDSQEFLISSPYGTIHIKGKNLTIAKMVLIMVFCKLKDKLIRLITLAIKNLIIKL